MSTSRRRGCACGTAAARSPATKRPSRVCSTSGGLFTRDAADDVVVSAEDVLLAALQISVGRGLVSRLDVPPPFAVIADEHVLDVHPLALELSELHRVPRGEAAKSPAVLERIWNNLELDRGGTIVALRRRLHDRRRRSRGRDVPARRALARGSDDSARAGRCRDRRQDRARPPRRQEPRRRLPLSGRGDLRPGSPLDARRETAA